MRNLIAPPVSWRNIVDPQDVANAIFGVPQQPIAPAAMLYVFNQDWTMPGAVLPPGRTTGDWHPKYIFKKGDKIYGIPGSFKGIQVQVPGHSAGQPIDSGVLVIDFIPGSVLTLVPSSVASDPFSKV